MGLLTETNEQYYGGQQAMVATGTGTPNEIMTIWGGDVILVNTTATTFANFNVKLNGVSLLSTAYTMLDGIVTMNTPTVLGDIVVIELTDEAKWGNNGSYSYISLDNIINNFLVAYVGEGKLIPSVKRTDVMFHAKRGLQEFSYDTLKSIKSQELTIPDSLSVIIPQDYVNYVNLSWIDDFGVKHVIYPTTLTSNPYRIPVQDNNGVPTQDSLGDNLQGSSITENRWSSANDRLISGDYDINFYNAGVYNWSWDKFALGRRYGANPETSQRNGWFTINEREGKFSFSSDLSGLIIILEYVSDGLSVDADTKVPKLAEEAMYMHIAYSILAGRANQPEYVVQRFKKDRRAALRNAKIRLSNIKLNEIVQVMRGKSKWIKH
ncbi:MAG: hypothetical protein GY787_25180 [Alteromonadales bacterium]|nr:hypothetical protein [Alteromonadales bacterium]